MFVGHGGRLLRLLRGMQEGRAGERRPTWWGADLGERIVRLTALSASAGYASDRTVFAGTSSGVFVSRNGGERFDPWTEGLAHLSVVSLTVSPHHAQNRSEYALALGGSVWRRFDA